MEESNLKQMMNDHDILIEVRTQVKDMRSDMRDMQTNILSRMKTVEDNKLEKSEFSKFIDNTNKVHEDHEKRIRNIETSITELVTSNKIAIRQWTVIMGVVSMLVSIALKFIN